MNIITPTTIEDHILVALQKGSLPIVELIKMIKIKRPRTTKQGVYLAVRNFKKQEIVVVHNKNISLNNVWLKTAEEFFTQAQYNNNSVVPYGNYFLNLKPGEKLQFFFRNPILTDAFWSHVFITLVENSSPQMPVLIYNPHEWFLLARTKNETDLFERIQKRGQKLAVLAGNNTNIDKSAKEYFSGTNEYETLPQPLFIKNNYYLNIIGDFIIEVWLDEKISSQIDEFYQGHLAFGDLEKKELEKILMQKGRNKFSISHNKRKADGLRSKFNKYFFLK
jgi:hypothetical protein